MKRKLTQLIVLLPLAIIASMCHEPSRTKERNIEPAFYYWRSTFKVNSFEKQLLDTVHARTIYLKFFDVDWNNAMSGPQPVAQVTFLHTLLLKDTSFHFIPVVFITNECIQKTDSNQVKPLATKIIVLVKRIADANNIQFKELQIDCDWTERSKDDYFKLLQAIKQQLSSSQQLSATIRLHQVKFTSRMGIPPVDRGLLMAYNMGDMKDPAALNSIIETKELNKYIGNLSNYPLPLDIGLPVFEWKVLFRNDAFVGLIENLPDQQLNNIAIKQLTGNRSSFLKDTLLNGYSFKEGDILRTEKSDYKEILESAKSLAANLRPGNCRVSLFHLDSIYLSKYSVYEIETIFNSLR